MIAIKGVCLCLFLMINISCSQVRDQKRDIKIDKTEKDANTDNRVEYLSITYDYGDGETLALIGTSRMILDSLFNVKSGRRDRNQILSQQNLKEEFRSVSFYILSSEAFKYLSDYMKNNCKYSKSDGWHSSFSIDFYSRKPCLIRNKDDVNNYFRGLIEWLNKSSNKSDYEGLIKEFQTYLKTY